MKRQIIPATDTLEVALVAAALFLSEDERRGKAAALEERLTRFRTAYRAVSEIVAEPAGVIPTLPRADASLPGPPERPFPPQPTFGDERSA